MLRDLSRSGRMAVRKAYWTTEESPVAIARRYGVVPDEVEGLAHWRIFATDEVPEWARPGKPREVRRGSLMELFGLPEEPVRTAPPPAPRPPVTAQPAPSPADGAEPASDGFTDADVVELRETYVEEPGILDSIAEAFEIPRDRVIGLLKGQERPEAGGPIYPDLDEVALRL